jgi:hypothetical protein
MARGKDGFTSLLVKSEGGECEEIVSEENGILMSLLLRQYFMALRVVGQWANWGPSMERHWGKVAAEVGTSHPLVTPRSTVIRPTTEKGSERLNERKRSWAGFTPTRLRSRRSSLAPMDRTADDTSSDGDGDEMEAVEVDDRELRIMRVVFRNWSRLAGVQGRTCDNLKEDEVEGLWTKAVAPKVEGRIKIVKGNGP